MEHFNASGADGRGPLKRPKRTIEVTAPVSRVQVTIRSSIRRSTTGEPTIFKGVTISLASTDVGASLVREATLSFPEPDETARRIALALAGPVRRPEGCLSRRPAESTSAEARPRERPGCTAQPAQATGADSRANSSRRCDRAGGR